MIEISGLTRYYGDLCALDHISLTIEKGKILGLLGPNGAGKTTAMRILTGYITPTEGKVTVKGYSIDSEMLEIKKLIGYLPESAPVYQDMLVYDYLKYVADIREMPGESREGKIKDIAVICGLESVMHRSIHELSKGFKQRVGLAHAMMSDPEILILDEPTSGLDPNQIVEIRDIIKKIGRENLLLKGAPEGEAKELFEGVAGVASIDSSGEDGMTRLRLSCRTGDDLREQAYSRVKTKDWALLELIRESKSLESIFSELTQEKEG
jgi:ABC-2 type transport system ATP-binding protein